MDIAESIKNRGVKVPEHELDADAFDAKEGFIQLIYGRIRQGKSTHAVRRMVDSLANGVSVYSNIALDLSSLELDDRLNFQIVFVNTVLFRKRYYRFLVSNFHFFDPITGECDGKQVFDPKRRGAEIEWLNTLTDCEIYYDEGQWLLDSYEKTDASVAKRKLITESGHMNRLIVIIAQRTQSVHVNARGNVNQFFRCSKKSFLGIINMLMVEEFQDMKGQDVDELSEPVSIQRYFSSKAYWKLFNTHYLRRGRPRSQVVLYEAYDLGFKDRMTVAFYNIFGFAFSLFKKAERFFSRPPLVKGDSTLTTSGVDESSPSLGVKLLSTTLKKEVSKPYGGLLSDLPTGSIHHPFGGDPFGLEPDSRTDEGIPF